MLKNLDSRINKALTSLSNSNECIAISNELEQNSESFGSKNNIVILLVDRKLAVRLENKEITENIFLPSCRISKKGAEIINKGGWLKHLERERIKTIRADRKDVFDFMLSKFKYYTFWPIFIMGIFGGVYSGYDFIKNLTKQECVQPKQMTKEEMELELTKLRTSISIHNNLDSLHKTKVLTTKIPKPQ